MKPEIETQFIVKDLFYILFKHKTMIIAIFLAVVLTTTIITFMMAPVYEASSKILIKLGRENIYVPTTLGANRGTPMVFNSSRQEERINAELEILQGRNFIEKVLNNIGVEKIYPAIFENKKPLIPLPSFKKLSPLDNATLTFQKKLAFEPVKESEIIKVKFQHNDPVVAAQVVNRLIDTFIEYRLSVYQQPKQYDFFNEQVNLMKKKLKESEKELENLSKQNNLSSLQEQKSLLLKQISDLEVALVETQNGISENMGKLQSFRGNLRSTNSTVAMGVETELNPGAITAIKDRLAELRLKREELLGKYTEQSLPLMNIGKEIEKAKQLLFIEEKTYHDKTVTSINHALNALKSKEKNQQKHLAAYQNKLRKLNSVELKLKELERRVIIDEENYQLYLRNMEQARISNAMDNEKIANISVVEPALPPLEPIKPNKQLNILLAIILGGFSSLGIAITTEVFSHSFNKSEDVSQHLGLPVLASIPELK